MANWEYISVDTDSMTAGKFYRVYTNKDNATLVLLKDDEDAKFNQVDINQESIESLQINQNNDKILILDNHARINNLENQSLKDNFIAGMHLASIRKNFVDSTHVEVEYGRGEINNIMVYNLHTDTPTQKIYKEVTSGIELSYKETYEDGELVSKKVIIDTMIPITGYVLIL